MLSRGKYIVSLVTTNRAETPGQDLLTLDPSTSAFKAQNNREIDKNIMVTATKGSEMTVTEASHQEGITTMLNNVAHGSLTPNRDRRGLAAPTNKCNREILQQHISSFHPCISHYRREHAPNRLYLPHNITIRSMHADYLQKYPKNKVSYYTYRKVMSDMNISFTKLGNEECDNCMVHIQHIKSHNEATVKSEEYFVENAEGPDEYQTDHRINITGRNAGPELNLSALQSSTTKFRTSCTLCMKCLRHVENAKTKIVEYKKDVAQKKDETKVGKQ
ncbi:unnamed protein product [Psylliodes chrysocephalus]|uniref:Uncharacterized protein n=1 Tax=Psylliodes chrysocephalus TaxID=3402493 RepID=A0A9P0CPW4_9CUCU|nr:unnamed protein product [Psylliodes chrysocephala]